MFIDIHHHMIYGIDDGAKSFEGTEKMIRDAVENEVDTIITTPHITPGHAPFPFEDYEAHLEETRRFLAQQNIPLKLYTGAEILYTSATPRLLQAGMVPTLAGSQFALVEFTPDDDYDYILDAAMHIASAGFVPIIAHVERYEQVRKVAQIEELRRECNAMIQMNASTVVRKHSFFKERWVRRILSEGLIDFVASDSHDLPGRASRMRPAFDRLKADYGREVAHKLTHGNAARLILGGGDLS